MGAENRVSKKWLLSTSSESEVEEDGSSSISNLSTKEEKQSIRESPTKLTQEDFDFGSILFRKTEMCSADELFFQGRILPTGSSSSGKGQSFSTSESINSGGNSDGDGDGDTPIEKSRMHYYFQCHHHHPSPKPQIRYSRIKNQNSKSTMWSHFRVGLSTTPEIELEDLKVRSTRRNRSSSSSSDNGISSGNFRGGKSDKKKKQGRFDITGCKSYVDVVEIVPTKVSKRREAKEKQAEKGGVTFEWLQQLSSASTQV